jgi:hypothetical protein
VSNQRTQNTVPRQTQPVTYLEAKRAQAQKMYQEEQEYWAKNADEIRRLVFLALALPPPLLRLVWWREAPC